jgi:hypothetical protein
MKTRSKISAFMAVMMVGLMLSPSALAEQGCYRVIFVAGGAQHDQIIRADSVGDARAKVKSDYPDARTIIISPTSCPS